MAVRTQSIEKSRLGRLLVNKGLITDAQLNRALVESHAAGQRLGEFLVAGGLISEKQLNQTLRRQKRVRHVATFLAMLIAPFQPMMAMSAAAATTTTATTSTISILSRPASITVKEGQSASFSVTASGSSLKYQWYKDGSKITGATSSTYTIAKTATGNAGAYQVKVYNSSTSNWTGKAYLTVEKATASSTTTSTSTATTSTSTSTTTTTTQTATAVEIVQRPLSTTVTAGSPASFNVVATGSGTLVYQWYKNGSKIAGATTASYTIPSAASTDAAYYQVKVSNSISVNWTGKAYLTVEAKVAPTPKLDIQVSLQPVGASVFAGKSHTFNIAATGSGTLKYQWRKNGSPIANAVLPYLSLSAIKLSDAAQYDVLITNTTGTVTSQAVKLDVAIDRSAKLSWVPPTTRVNGTALKAGDIASYRIYHSTEDGAVEQVYDVSAAQNLYEMSGLVSGKHFFAITAIDTKGYESDLSNMANKEILTGL
ncbi:MAG: immunoglobulin domain-containing protein [Hahellaceae bacterium]|nr:immunoglobulin domain-containing protein [Hahellaceae bacterium]